MTFSKEMAGKVSIVIVNWNAGEQLRKCVDSILQFDLEQVEQIVVVDNGSMDGSEKSVAEQTTVTLITAGRNLGFGKACNLGAEETKSEFILFLNPDACLYSDSLHKVLAFMQMSENAQVGICGVQLVDEDGHIARSCARFPSVKSSLAHAVGIDRIYPEAGYQMVEWDHALTRSVNHVIGAFFLVRRCVFEALHGFDEQFFVYLEDLDFSRRASQLGWSSFYYADTQAFHAGGGTSNQVKSKRLFYSLRSRILYAFKHFGFWSALTVLFFILFVELFSRSMLAVGRRSFVSLRETWVAYCMLYCWLPPWVFKGITR